KQDEKNNVAVAVSYESDFENKKENIQNQEVVNKIVTEFDQDFDCMITSKKAEEIICIAKQHEKDPLECLHNVVAYFSNKDKPENPIGAVIGNIKNGWYVPRKEKKKQAIKKPSQKLPESVRKQGQIEVETNEEEQRRN